MSIKLDSRLWDNIKSAFYAVAIAAMAVLAFVSYKITIPKLEADINNLAPMFERKPTEAIRKALEKSLARPKNLERLARKRLPLYVPLDIDLDVEVFEGAD